MTNDRPWWQQLEAQPRVVFDQTPLALTLCQVRFPPKLSVNDPASVAPFQDAIQDDYPEFHNRQNVAEIQISAGGNQVGIPPTMAPTVWEFSDLGGNWTGVLTQEFISLETRAYDDFVDFLDRLRRILIILTKTIRPAVGRRLGLRYINEIRPGHQEWARVINRELLGVLAVDLFSKNAEQTLQYLGLRDGETRINIQHGLFPRGTTVQPGPGTEPKDDPFYLLDFDVFHEFPTPDSLPMDAKLICELVDHYHRTISQLFRWAVTQDYVRTLGERIDASR